MTDIIEQIRQREAEHQRLHERDASIPSCLPAGCSPDQGDIPILLRRIEWLVADKAVAEKQNSEKAEWIGSLQSQVARIQIELQMARSAGCVSPGTVTEIPPVVIHQTRDELIKFFAEHPLPSQIRPGDPITNREPAFLDAGSASHLERGRVLAPVELDARAFPRSPSLRRPDRPLADRTGVLDRFVFDDVLGTEHQQGQPITEEQRVKIDRVFATLPTDDEIRAAGGSVSRMSIDDPKGYILGGAEPIGPGEQPSASPDALLGTDSAASKRSRPNAGRPRNCPNFKTCRGRLKSAMDKTAEICRKCRKVAKNG